MEVLLFMNNTHVGVYTSKAEAKRNIQAFYDAFSGDYEVSFPETLDDSFCYRVTNFNSREWDEYNCPIIKLDDFPFWY